MTSTDATIAIRPLGHPHGLEARVAPGPLGPCLLLLFGGQLEAGADMGPATARLVAWALLREADRAEGRASR